ncbi:MAG: ABC transporter substrate-binding protein [Chloroflexota bacterium]
MVKGNRFFVIVAALVVLSMLLVPLGCAQTPAASPTAAPAAPTKAPATEPTKAATEPTKAPAAEPTKAPTGAPAPASIKIGLMYSLSGAGSSIGTTQMQGAKLAIDEINAAGGLDWGGKKVKVEAVTRDDESKPDVAVRRLREMVQDDKVVAVVGGTMANISGALNEEVKKDPSILLVLTNGIPETSFTKAGKAATMLCSTGSTLSTGLAGGAYVADNWKPKSVALFLPDYAYGQDQAKGIKRIFEKSLPNVKLTEVWHPVGTADLSPYIIKVMDANPEVVIMGQWGNDGITGLKQAFELGLTKKSKVWFDWMMDQFAYGIPPEAMAGLTSQMFFYHDMTGFKDAEVVAGAKAFTEQYSKVYNIPPDPYAMTAYVGAKEAMRGISLAQSTEAAKAYKALMDNPEFKSPKGPAKWRIDGRPMYKYYTFIVEGKGASERKDPKTDYAKIVGAYEGDAYITPLSEGGW